MDYPVLEVEGDLPIMVKELISSYKDHILTLKARVKELEDKYEPKVQLENLKPGIILPKPALRNRIRTSSALIEALERRTLVKNITVNPEDVK